MNKPRTAAEKYLPVSVHPPQVVHSSRTRMPAVMFHISILTPEGAKGGGHPTISLN